MTIAGFKGFDEQLQCRGLQYVVGKTYETDQHPVTDSIYVRIPLMCGRIILPRRADSVR